MSHKFPVSFDKEKDFIVSGNLCNRYSLKYISSFLLLISTFVPIVQVHDDSTQPVWTQKLSTPVFDCFQRIEGPATKKEVSHGAEQVIVGWRRKIKSICWMGKKFNSLVAVPWFLLWWEQQCVLPEHCHVAEAHAFHWLGLDNDGPRGRRKRDPLVHCRAQGN